MEDYLKHIGTFHKDLVTSFSDKEKYIRCSSCENRKQFIVNDNKLIYNCGSNSGKCGNQFIITIPEYIHYEKMMLAFQQSIHGSFNYNEDINDFSEYNLEELAKYLKLNDELQEYHELKKTILKDSQKLTSLFISSNKLKQYYDSLSSLNTDIQKNNLRKKKIFHELHNNQLLTIDEKISMRKEYAKIISQEKNELYPMYESILNHENNHYLLLQPKDSYVEKINTLYLEKGIKTTNLKKKIENESEALKVEMIKEISKKQSDKSKKSIKYFSRSKDNKWLSAFNKAEPFEYEGFTYPTVEHAFHAQKIDPKDPKEKEYKEYLSNPDLKPNEAKMYGGKTSFKKNKFTFRNDWDKIKLKLMEEITEAYYSVNPQMKQKLIDTKDAELLHTGSRIDPFWGLTKDGGENNHGKILMKLREKYS